MTTARQSRRERQRRSTLEEIVGIARSLLAAGQEVSLRAVATEMGVTPPALYRYLPSVRGLRELVATDIIQEVAADMAEAVAGHAESDPAARLVAAIVELRQWAITHCNEFRLIFTTGLGEVGPANLLPDAATRMPLTHLLTQLVVELWERMSPTTEGDPHGGLWERVHLMPEAVSSRVLQCGIELYGVVVLESFGYIQPELVASGRVFKTSLAECLESLGAGTHWARVSQIVDEAIGSTDSSVPEPPGTTAFVLPVRPAPGSVAVGARYPASTRAGGSPRTPASGASGSA